MFQKRRGGGQCAIISLISLLMIMICFILFYSLGSNIAWFILFAYDKLNVGALLGTDQRLRVYLHIK